MRKRAIKKCKGTNKAKGYGCGQEKEMYRYGLCKDCYKDFLFNTETGRKIFERDSLRGIKRVKKEITQKEKEKKRKEKKEAEIKSELESKLQNIVNEIVRLIDIDKGCISCYHGWDGNWKRQAHAGHFYSRGAHRQLRYLFINIYKQCSICNYYKGGRDRDTAANIKKIYGEKHFDLIESQKGRRPLNWTKDILRDKIKIARQIRKSILSGKSYTRYELDKILNDIDYEM